MCSQRGSSLACARVVCLPPEPFTSWGGLKLPALTAYSTVEREVCVCVCVCARENNVKGEGPITKVRRASILGRSAVET